MRQSIFSSLDESRDPVRQASLSAQSIQSDTDMLPGLDTRLAAASSATTNAFDPSALAQFGPRFSQMPIFPQSSGNDSAFGSGFGPPGGQGFNPFGFLSSTQTDPAPPFVFGGSQSSAQPPVQQAMMEEDDSAAVDRADTITDDTDMAPDADAVGQKKRPRSEDLDTSGAQAADVQTATAGTSIQELLSQRKALERRKRELKGKANEQARKNLTQQIRNLTSQYTALMARQNNKRARRGAGPELVSSEGRPTFIDNSRHLKSTSGLSPLSAARLAGNRALDLQALQKSAPGANALSDAEHDFYEQHLGQRQRRSGQHSYVHSSADPAGRNISTISVLDPVTGRTGRGVTPAAQGMVDGDDSGHGACQSHFVDETQADRQEHMTAENRIVNQGTTRSIEDYALTMALADPDREVIRHRQPIYRTPPTASLDTITQRPDAYYERILQRGEGGRLERRASITMTNPIISSDHTSVGPQYTEDQIMAMREAQRGNSSTQ